MTDDINNSVFASKQQRSELKCYNKKINQIMDKYNKYKFSPYHKLN